MIHNYLIKTKKNKKRIGRGYGSGKGGHTVGRGSKGAKSRTGYKLARRGFEGGQMPLSRRIPKLKGFSRAFFKLKNPVEIVKIERLNDFKDGDTINLEKLREAGLITEKGKNVRVKILNNGELKKKITIENILVSKSVQQQIEKAGGKVL